MRRSVSPHSLTDDRMRAIQTGLIVLPGVVGVEWEGIAVSDDRPERNVFAEKYRLRP